MKQIKIFCHTCDGIKTFKEKRYPDGKMIIVPCPECEGKGWVWSSVMPESMRYEAKNK